MFAKTVTVAILAFSSSVLAAPQIIEMPTGTITEVVEEPHGTALGGALDIAAKFREADLELSNAPQPTAAPFDEPVVVGRDGHLYARGFSKMTIKIVNNFGKDISTRHVSNAGVPSPVQGGKGEGVLKAGATGTQAVPSGWAGRIAIVQNGGGRRFNGDESLVEASFVKQGGSQALFDVNVSYVDGFSVPIVCSCDVGVVGGCNKNLWGLNSCPNDNGVGSCKNPMRSGNSATAFFKPCQHAAYAYAYDNAANTGNNVCRNDVITCCVGTSGCPKNPRQSA